ncbi:MAG: hypothetical protein WC052_06165 [Patescibacteria group bacterium]
MNSVLCNRVKALCESLGGIWVPNDLDWLECKLEGLRICLGPLTGLVEVNCLYGPSIAQRIYHEGDTDNALIQIASVHKIAKVQVSRFRDLAQSVNAFLLGKKIPVEMRMVDGDFVKFTLFDRHLFHIDAAHLLDGGPFELQVGIDEYGVEILDDVVGCLNKTTQQDVDAPWMHISKSFDGDFQIHFIGDLAYFIPAMLRHGVESITAHVGEFWPHSPDKILHVLLGNSTPEKKTYYTIRFTDGVIPTEVQNICNN